MSLSSYIVSNTQLPQKAIAKTLQLLEEDASIPFIARYRKEMTGNLDEVEIGKIAKAKADFEELEKRKKAILKAISQQESLPADLEE